MKQVRKKFKLVFKGSAEGLKQPCRHIAKLLQTNLQPIKKLPILKKIGSFLWIEKTPTGQTSVNIPQTLRRDTQGSFFCVCMAILKALLVIVCLILVRVKSSF